MSDKNGVTTTYLKRKVSIEYLPTFSNMSPKPIRAIWNRGGPSESTLAIFDGDHSSKNCSSHS